MIEETEPQIVFAEEGEEFQTYVRKDGTQIKTGTPIGIEVYENDEWKLMLLEDVYFA